MNADYRHAVEPEPTAPKTDIRDVVLRLPDLPPLTGVVSWVSDTKVGISFNRCIDFEQLARCIQPRRSLTLRFTVA